MQLYTINRIRTFLRIHFFERYVYSLDVRSEGCLFERTFLQRTFALKVRFIRRSFFTHFYKTSKRPVEQNVEEPIHDQQTPWSPSYCIETSQTSENHPFPDPISQESPKIAGPSNPSKTTEAEDSPQERSTTGSRASATGEKYSKELRLKKHINKSQGQAKTGGASRSHFSPGNA